MSLGFGIVGSGMIARIHAQAIQAQEHGRLLACCDIRQDAAETFAREFGCRAYGSMEEFVRHADMEVVNICTPSGSHMEPAMAAAEAEKHLIIEKPLEITLERCDRSAPSEPVRQISRTDPLPLCVDQTTWPWLLI